MFADLTLARSIEAAEARFTLVAAHTITAEHPSAIVVRLGSGAAVSFPISTPFNKVIGLGLEPLDWTAFDAFERECLATGRDIRLEVCTLADIELLSTLTSRGYVLHGFENVLGQRLEPSALPRRDTEIAVSRVLPEGRPAWLDTVITGFLHVEDTAGPASPDEGFMRDTLLDTFRCMADVPGFTEWIARRAGAIAGGASMRVDGDIAQLCGAATLPEHRRKGVQGALLHARLLAAAESGCHMAVVTTAPGSKSQANVMRAGFSLLYARAVLVKQAVQ